MNRLLNFILTLPAYPILIIEFVVYLYFSRINLGPVEFSVYLTNIDEVGEDSKQLFFNRNAIHFGAPIWIIILYFTLF